MGYSKFYRFVYLLAAGWFFYSCNLARPFVYNLPDERDARRFPYRTINAADSVFNFARSPVVLPEITNIKVESKPLNSVVVPLGEFVQRHKTISFVLIRNDSIVYEYYAKGYNSKMNVTSFSISKAYITMLTGIAINDGLIKNVSQPITDFITEWKNKPGYSLITIKDLLRHTSGLKFRGGILNPDSDQWQFYYGNRLRKRTLSTKIREAPGLRFDYQSENTCLLGLILERVTGKSLSAYLQEKIWSQIGTEAPALWNTDREDSAAVEKAFCCLNARTLDFAKFARLLLNKGNWNGKQIVPAQWIAEATKRTNEGGGKITYGYNMGLGPAEYESFYPMGLYGQWLYVYPEKKVIIVRFGKANIRYNPNYWKQVMLQLADQL